MYPFAPIYLSISLRNRRIAGRERTVPVLGWFVQRIHHVKLGRMLLLELIKSLAEEDVGLSDVGVEEREFCGVRGRREGMCQNLIKRGAMRRVGMGHTVMRKTYMPLPPPIKPTSSNSLTEEWEVKQK
jgi:hypothetical protein